MTEMTKPCIALSRTLPDAVVAALRELGEIRMPVAGQTASLPDLLRDADHALVTPFEPVDANALAGCTRLRTIITISAGYDHIDVPACTARGINVANTPGAGAAATADLAFALMLAASRRILEADAFVRAGKWVGQAVPVAGQDVHHKRMGIIGLGRIGMEIAKRARGFDMEVTYHKRHRLSSQEEQALGVRHVAFDELLAQSDVVMVQVPYGPETHHLVGAPELAQMKKTSVLVNAARGGVIDDAALAAALRSGQIAAAGLDVTEGEPNVHPGLLDLPNVVLTPHIGPGTDNTIHRMMREAVDNLIATVRGGAPSHCVN
jgi:gluconate 2-dehydrogenase